MVLNGKLGVCLISYQFVVVFTGISIVFIDASFISSITNLIFFHIDMILSIFCILIIVIKE